LVVAGGADTLSVDQSTVVLSEAGSAGAGGGAGLAEDGALGADSAAGIVESVEAVAVVGERTGGVVRADVTDGSDVAGETLVGAGGAESSILVESRGAGAERVVVNSGSSHTAVADGGRSDVAALAERSEAGITLAGVSIGLDNLIVSGLALASASDGVVDETGSAGHAGGRIGEDVNSVVLGAELHAAVLDGVVGVSVLGDDHGSSHGAGGGDDGDVTRNVEGDGDGRVRDGENVTNGLDDLDVRGRTWGRTGDGDNLVKDDVALHRHLILDLGVSGETSEGVSEGDGDLVGHTGGEVLEVEGVGEEDTLAEISECVLFGEPVGEVQLGGSLIDVLDADSNGGDGGEVLLLDVEHVH
jgi:hypothetical protein